MELENSNETQEQLSGVETQESNSTKLAECAVADTTLQSEPKPDLPRRLFSEEDLLSMPEPDGEKPLHRLLQWLGRLWPFRRQKDRIQEPFWEDYLQASFRNHGGVGFSLGELEEVAARSRYGPLVIKGYLGLVAMQVSVPLILWFIAVTWGQPSAFSSGLRDVKDFVIALSAGLSGISGLAGYVIGRYFREYAE